MRRHRRLLAALLAGAATLLALTSIRGGTVVADAGPATDPSLPRSGEASVPVSLDSTALTSVLHVGDVIDLVQVDEAGTARVVAPDARVLELPGGTGPLTGASAAVVLVAVPRATALDLSGAASLGGLTFLLPAPG